MFIGHYGVGLAANKFAPRAQLGVLIVAAPLLEIFWAISKTRLRYLRGWTEKVLWCLGALVV